MSRKTNDPTYGEQNFSELSTVESQRNEILQEEFPEGPYGATTNAERLGKATGWEEGQHSTSTRFTYETRNLHENLSRRYPVSHPTHDEPGRDKEDL
ncbi:hypothetical protein [Brevibacillus dissolubilis]|uniref:hypothetical protein n=1 Tax=Brevibacillus dissolubilis TaxID=1844116 RepID=UPI001116A9DF|nr:hypothetical protein [Brevibacillus dissolubilis]